MKFKRGQKIKVNRTKFLQAYKEWQEGVKNNTRPHCTDGMAHITDIKYIEPLNGIDDMQNCHKVMEDNGEQWAFHEDWFDLDIVERFCE